MSILLHEEETILSHSGFVAAAAAPKVKGYDVMFSFSKREFPAPLISGFSNHMDALLSEARDVLCIQSQHALKQLSDLGHH